MTDTSTRIAAMDAQGIDVEALSINPYWYRAERDVAAQLIKVQNETLVEFCAANPDRFVAFATAALQHPDLAAQQVEYAVKTLGFRGVGVAGSVAGEELANPRFHPFWAKCEELGVLVFMHPLGTRELEPSGRLAGSGLLTNTIGNPLETTIALSHLIFEGTLDRFPGLKICAAHGGGFLPSYANRSDAVITVLPRPGRPAAEEKPDRVSADGQLFFDTIVFTPGGAAPPDRRNRRRPDHDRHRLSVPVDQHRGRPRAQHAGPDRRPADRHPRRHRGAAARHRPLTTPIANPIPPSVTAADAPHRSPPDPPPSTRSPRPRHSPAHAPNPPPSGSK